ncbi:MAG: undecaprenyldiphospho-muramoylpentapeptide beta-N-acetylglucosaminyltransferase, partial [Clostridiales Family XIII bacterium]|nr:undecaprenyldiphospho-muramoylpentapeptide beta-N-acetylglucosaminyltransferase [Clostridiales Family XIII bacterium]
GGTGGHIYPAVAIAEKIREKQPDSEILFIGTEAGMEKDIVPEKGFDIRFVKVRGFYRRKIWRNISVVSELLRASRDIRGILRSFKADIAVGAGGYVSGPVIREAHKLGIKTCVHEQNACPGLSNILAERYADRVLLAFEEGRRRFRNQKKLAVTGNPVRENFIRIGVGESRAKLGAGPDEFVLLCFGGSRGAMRLNETILEILDNIGKIRDMRLYWITGRIYYADIAGKIAARRPAGPDRAAVIEYTDQMHLYLAAADLVVGRSGAITVSELAARGRPSILIPSPNVTGNHQYFNAKALADKGAAVLIEEKELTPERLLNEITRLHGDKGLLSRMRAAAGSLGRLDAAERIYSELMDIYSRGD